MIMTDCDAVTLFTLVTRSETRVYLNVLICLCWFDVCVVRRLVRAKAPKMVWGSEPIVQREIVLHVCSVCTGGKAPTTFWVNRPYWLFASPPKALCPTYGVKPPIIHFL